MTCQLCSNVQRYMVHLKNTTHTPRDATTLLYRARKLAGSDVTIRDARVSRKYIEFDMSVPDGWSIDVLVRKLDGISSQASYEHIVERHMEKDEAVERAVELFNDEKYWGAHEALEGVWKGASGDEKDILNGIILVAAAFVHDEKDEPEVCVSILRRALKKLGGIDGKYQGIDIGRMVELVSKIINSGKIERFTI